MRRSIFTLSIIIAVLNMMVIGIFMPAEVITLYGLNGMAVAYGSKWFYALYALIPIIISGVFLIADISSRKNGGEDDNGDEPLSAIDEFLSGHSKKSDNADLAATWFFAVISWVLTGLALNEIENIGVIMPSIIVVMLSAVLIFTSALYSGGDMLQICGVEINWLAGKDKALKRAQRLSTMLGVISGMLGVCLAAWSLVINNNIPNCIAVAELFIFAFLLPIIYAHSQKK